MHLGYHQRAILVRICSSTARKSGLIEIKRTFSSSLELSDDILLRHIRVTFNEREDCKPIMKLLDFIVSA